MVASLLRIVHSGPQNERLNETQSQQQQDPQPAVKFFQKIFRPSGRFTTQWVRLDFNTPPNFGQNATIPLPKKGHLLSRLYLITNYPTSSNTGASWTNSIGHALIESAELQIGGARIERLDGQLMEVLDEFNTPLEKVPVVNRLIGRKDNNYIYPTNTTSSVTRSSNLIVTSNLNYLTQSEWIYYYETTSNLVVTSNTGYNLELIITGSNLTSVTSNLTSVTSNNMKTFSNTNSISDFQSSSSINKFSQFTVPSDYLVGCNVTLNYNFAVMTTGFNLNNNESYLSFQLLNITPVTSYTFSNILPPTSLQPDFTKIIPNVMLPTNLPVRSRFGYTHGGATNIVTFSNIQIQLYYTYPSTEYIYTSNYTFTSNYTYTYSLQSNFYVNYTSEYVYSQTLLSNEVITQTPYYTYESNSYVITSNYTTTDNFVYLNPLSNPLVTATPLPFFFCRGDAAAALPVDAIQADEIRLQFAFRPFTSLYTIPYSINNTTLCNYYYTSDILMSNNATSNIMSTTPSLPETLRGDTEGSAFANPFAGRQQPTLGDTYLLAEYIYLDAPEANRFRIADISLPITQHYSLQALDTQGLPQAQIDIQTPNPVRDIFFYCQPWTAPAYNAHFLATKYISAASDAFQPWWPDADGLNPLVHTFLKPGFWPDYFDSEPVATVALQYEGRLTKLSTANPALFRSIIPSLEQKKSPWVNRYYYNISLGLQHGVTDRTRTMGEANYDKITKRDLQLTFPREDDGSAPRLWIRPWVETYNILRIYGGRAGTLFGY